MGKFRCKKCFTDIEMNSQPNFCPNCGSNEIIRQRTPARITCEKKIAELENLLPKVEKAYKEYFNLYIQAVDIYTYLRQNKKRGNVTEDEIPHLKKPNINKSLSEFRKQRREEKEQK